MRPTPPKLYKGHIDPDCEVYRGVGGFCTCETPEEKVERQRELDERDSASNPVSAPPTSRPSSERKFAGSDCGHEPCSTEAYGIGRCEVHHLRAEVTRLTAELARMDQIANDRGTEVIRLEQRLEKLKHLLCSECTRVTEDRR